MTGTPAEPPAPHQRAELLSAACTSPLQPPGLGRVALGFLPMCWGRSAGQFWLLPLAPTSHDLTAP